MMMFPFVQTCIHRGCRPMETHSIIIMQFDVASEIMLIQRYVRGNIWSEWQVYHQIRDQIDY